MNLPKQKVKLSPKLSLGVGRGTDRGSLLPYATMIFVVISAVLAIRAGYMVVHHSSPSDTPANPQVLGATDTPTETQKAFKDYAVKKGDTVFSIAQANGLQWTMLATLNNLKAPFTLKAGDVLQLPQ